MDDHTPTLEELLGRTDLKNCSIAELFSVGDRLMASGACARALAILTWFGLPKTVSDQAAHSSTWFKIAQCHFGLQRLATAWLTADRAKRLNANNVDAWELQANISWRLGNLSDAQSLYSMAIFHALQEKPERRSSLYRCYSELLREAGEHTLAAHNRLRADRILELAARSMRCVPEATEKTTVQG